MDSNPHRLVEGWVSTFASADREMEWLAAEQDAQVWLGENTLVLGKMDAVGKDAEDKLFFGEWKTANPRERNTWKAVWRMNPQSLTYGVLAASMYPECHRFTVRKAFKSDPPTYDHAWYKYSEAELTHWKRELMGIGNEIRAYVKDGVIPWPTNFTSCFKYGLNYACPYFEVACSKVQWDARPAGAVVEISPARAEVLSRLNEAERLDVVVLSPTSVATWLSCRERYRREYVENLRMPAGVALQIGSDFHELVGSYYKGMVKR